MCPQAAQASFAQARSASTHTRLEFEEVALQGYGPFKDLQVGGGRQSLPVLKALQGLRACQGSSWVPMCPPLGAYVSSYGCLSMGAYLWVPICPEGSSLGCEGVWC